jgi:PAS domain S-box-containing protein
VSAELLTSSNFTVLVFPSDDVVLIERIRELLRGHEGRTGNAQPERLRAALRTIYPHLDVRVRNPLGGFGERTLYVFRDGGASAQLGPEEWIRDEATARLVTDDAGLYIAANTAAAVLFGAALDEILGRRAGSFTEPDARIEDAPALWRLLQRTGRLHSLAVVRRPDGDRIRVEFVTLREGAGEGRHVTYLRAFGA